MGQLLKSVHSLRRCVLLPSPLPLGDRGHDHLHVAGRVLPLITPHTWGSPSETKRVAAGGKHGDQVKEEERGADPFQRTAGQGVSPFARPAGSS